jgi:hypothetical protein
MKGNKEHENIHAARPSKQLYPEPIRDLGS